MQQVIKKTHHHWTPSDKAILKVCKDKEQARIAGQDIGVASTAAEAMWRHLVTEKTTQMAYFDYSKIRPLRSLFVRCPVCNGTTGVNGNAYCHSCLSQWNPVTLQPLKGLHDYDLVD
jgi:hypothetical protein